MTDCFWDRRIGAFSRRAEPCKKRKMRHFFSFAGCVCLDRVLYVGNCIFFKNGYNFRERIIFAENKRTDYFVTQTDEKD